MLINEYFKGEIQPVLQSGSQVQQAHALFNLLQTLNVYKDKNITDEKQSTEARNYVRALLSMFNKLDKNNPAEKVWFNRQKRDAIEKSDHSPEVLLI